VTVSNRRRVETATFLQGLVWSHRVVAFCFAPCSPLFELASVLVGFDHIARFIIKADQSIANRCKGLVSLVHK
jgi:hypothetical protein